MLILAVALVLIASVFAFVLSSPGPSVPSTSEFTIALQKNATAITNISVTYVEGPTIASSTTTLASVVLTSAALPKAFPSSFSVASGHVTPSASWNAGQVWWLALSTYKIPLNDNITVQIFSNQRLVFDGVAPGPHGLIPPYLISAWTNPTTLVHGSAYTLYASVSFPDGLGGGGVLVNASRANGPVAPQSMTAGNTSGVSYWSYTPTTYPTAAGTYDLYLYFTDSLGISSTAVVPLTFS